MSPFTSLFKMLGFSKEDPSVQSYMAVPYEELNHDPKEAHPMLTDDTSKQISSRTIKIALSLAAILVTASVIALGSTHMYFRTPLEPLECGSSREEALKLGCRFDMMSFCWLPEPCYDSDLTEEFLSLQDWQWYADDAGKVPVTYEEAHSATHFMLYVREDYHLVHCTYMWKKLHRAMSNGGPIDSYIGNFTHTNHCSMTLLRDHPGSNQSMTFIVVQYQSCPRQRSEKHQVAIEDQHVY